jgi:hypothetical protein
MRCYQISLRSTLILIAYMCCLLAIAATVVQRWRGLQIQTVSVHMSHSRSVWFGGASYTPTDAVRELQCSASLLKSNGFRARLLIECDNDVETDDLNEMLRSGRIAGFDIVESIRLRSQVRRK